MSGRRFGFSAPVQPHFGKVATLTPDMRRVLARIAVATALTGATALPATARSESVPTQSWKIVRTMVQAGDGVRFVGVDGEDNPKLAAQVRGSVSTGVRNALNGVFIGPRATRLVATIREYNNLSAGEALIAGGRLGGALDLELRDAVSGEVLARGTDIEFSRIVPSGLLGFAPALFSGGASQEQRLAEEVAVATREWVSGLDCADAGCTVATNISPAGDVPEQNQLAQVPTPAPRPAPQPELAEADIAAPIEEPEIVAEGDAAEGDAANEGGFLSSVTSIFGGDEAAEAEPDIEVAAVDIAPEPEPSVEAAVPQPAVPESVVADPDVPQPELAGQEPPEETDPGGGFFSTITSVFDGDDDGDDDGVDAETDVAVETSPVIEQPDAEIEIAAIDTQPEPPVRPVPQIAAPQIAEPEAPSTAGLATDDPAPGESTSEGGFFSSITSIFGSDDPVEENTEIAATPVPQPVPGATVPEATAPEVAPEAPVEPSVEPTVEPPVELAFADPEPEVLEEPDVQVPNVPELAEPSVDAQPDTQPDTGSGDGGLVAAISDIFEPDPTPTGPAVEAPVVRAPITESVPSQPLPRAAPRPTSPVADEPEPQIDLAEVEPAAAPEAPSVALSTEPDVALAIPGDGGVSVPEAPEAVIALADPDASPTAPRVDDDPEPDPNQIARAPSAPSEFDVPDTNAPGAADAAGLRDGGSALSSDAPELQVPPAPSAGDAVAPPRDVEPDIIAPQPRPAPAQPATPEPEAVVEAETSPAPAAQPGPEVALVNPFEPVARPNPAPSPNLPELATSPDPLETPAPADDGPVSEVQTQIAAVDPTAEGPTLANAQWIGITPAVSSNDGGREGLWIAGPFDRNERVGWITDTATGATSRVTLVWREAAPGSRALLSGEAAKALGLVPGNVANVAVYVPR